MFNWKGYLNFFKSFSVWGFLLSFMACDENWPFLILYEKYLMSSYQPDKKLKHTHVPGNGPDWLGSLSIICMNLIQIQFFFLSEKSKGNFCVAIPSQSPLDLSNSFWILNRIDTQTLWNLCIGASSMNVMQYNIPFPNFWWRKLHHGAAFFTDSIELTLVWCTVDKTWNKVDAQN